ncbi:MAG: ABC transporter ATP-binding protein [Bryobacterales bacterium]|nr:ABC transporter ATP-binding protein [Bryobacterales bacterium]
MLEIEELRKSYGDFTAVHSVSLRAGGGEVFGLLGPNGAGKTTTIHCIGGLLTPTSGHIRVNGHDVVREGAKARASLGVAPQEIALYEELSAKENLEFWGVAQGLASSDLRARIPEVLEQVGLLDRAKDPVKNFSGGMKRRMNFACGIVHRPKVLLLDEPTAGVDPQSRVRILELVRAQAREGACVLYTTHYMEEAEALCDRLAIVDHGRLIAQGTLGELRAMLAEKDLVRLAGSFPAAVAALRLADIEVLQHAEDALSLSVTQAAMRLPEIFGAIAAAGGEVRGATVTQPSLESLFIKLTGKELRE